MTMRPVVSAFVLALVLVACGRTGGASRPIVGADGVTWWRVECRHREGCPAEAQSRCPDGYVKGDDTDKGTFTSDGAPTAKTKERRVMMIKCVGKGHGDEFR